MNDENDEYDPQAEVDDDIRVITENYRAWDEADLRSHAACHRTLGEIFARSGNTGEDVEKKQALEDRVSQLSDVAESSRFYPSEKTAAELHLTLLFGLKHRRTVKANWLKAIGGAEKALERGELIKERSADAFVALIEEKGIAGLHALVDGTSQERADKKLTAVEEFGGEPFEMPIMPEDGEEIAGDLAVLLVRIKKEGAGEPRAEALGLLTQKSVVAAACAALQKQRAKEDRQFVVDTIEAMEKAETPTMTKALVIPPRWRKDFDGRVHFVDEDERADFLHERKALIDHERKKRIARGQKKIQPFPWELARRGKGKAKLPLPGTMSAATTLADERAASTISTPQSPSGEASRRVMVDPLSFGDMDPVTGSDSEAVSATVDQPSSPIGDSDTGSTVPQFRTEEEEDAYWTNIFAKRYGCTFDDVPAAAAAPEGADHDDRSADDDDDIDYFARLDPDYLSRGEKEDGPTSEQDGDREPAGVNDAEGGHDPGEEDDVDYFAKLRDDDD